MTKDQLRLARLRKANLADAATIRELVWLAHNDDAALLALINSYGGVNEATIITNGTTSVTYDNLVGTFTVGEIVEDSSTGATGVVVTDSGTVLVLNNVTGQFNDNDTISGATSAATADVNGATVYAVVDLTSTNDATVFILVSSANNLAIGSFTNAPVYPFKIIASGTTVFEIINGTIKTIGGVDAVLKGSTGDFANFETRSSIIKETSAVIYA